jgi:tRNA(Ile)-lysidine synthase
VSNQRIERMTQEVCSDLESLGLHSYGVAVSGGSDSIALLHMLADWEFDKKPDIMVASVDHGLRTESQSEIKFVKEICKKKKIKHFSLRVTANLLNAGGNLQENARIERYELLKNWAVEQKLQCVLVGHTLDDQEETLLMRFFRGSGVDGLVSMQKKVFKSDILWIRPLLKFRREELQHYLKINKHCWVDDPSNYDKKYLRVRIRELLQQLRRDNLLTSNFVKTSEHMSRASKLLKKRANSDANNLLSFDEAGQITFDSTKFLELFEDTQYRILAGIISWFSGTVYKPRFSQLEHLYCKLVQNKDLAGLTLGGTIFRKRKGVVTVVREFASVESVYVVKDQDFIWDNRWLITMNVCPKIKLFVKPYGSLDFENCDIDFNSDFDKEALATVPAIVTHSMVKFVPLSNLKYDVEIKLLNQNNEFYKFF